MIHEPNSSTDIEHKWERKYINAGIINLRSMMTSFCLQQSSINHHVRSKRSSTHHIPVSESIIIFFLSTISTCAKWQDTINYNNRNNATTIHYWVMIIILRDIVMNGHVQKHTSQTTHLSWCFLFACVIVVTVDIAVFS